ncbi:MAG TPA: DNA-binding response regulator [Pseudonocardiaceae bacterium]|nr:DNA-binding response regulator [Pseudonocardiaceae bacterium]
MSTLTAGARPGDGRVITLRGEAELFARAGHLFAAREEFVCAAMDMKTWTTAGARHRKAEQITESLAGGLKMQKMYNPAVMTDPADAAHLREIESVGVRVRICPTTLAHETIIIDRKVAILAGPPVAGMREYSVVMAPEVVAGVRSLFQASWAGATDLSAYLPSAAPAVDEQGMAILRLLSAGQKDEAAARSMGVSVRTYRRRVAELMTLLGAESRFQAGERARALGLRW